MNNYKGLTTNHTNRTNLAQNLMNTKNPGKIRTIDAKVRGVGVVRGYSLNHAFSLDSILVPTLTEQFPALQVIALFFSFPH
jgi:hypothetical protein